jgi:hypothetical protein
LNDPSSVGISFDDTKNSNTEEAVKGFDVDLYSTMNTEFGFFKEVSRNGNYTQIVHFNRTKSIKAKIVSPSTNQIINLNGGNWEILLKKCA